MALRGVSVYRIEREILPPGSNFLLIEEAEQLQRRYKPLLGAARDREGKYLGERRAATLLHQRLSLRRVVVPRAVQTRLHLLRHKHRGRSVYSKNYGRG